MPTKSIEEGGFYVGGKKRPWSYVREVLDIADDGYVWYQQYSLSDGKPVGNSHCYWETLCTWAGREATTEEVARLRLTKAAAERRAEAMKFADMFLKRLPTGQLLAELRRRGATASELLALGFGKE